MHWNPAAACSAATEGTRTRLDSRCRAPGFHNCVRNWTSTRGRIAITFEALGWHMAERMQQAQLLPGDTLDIAFSLDQNEHPEFGGLELSLRDFVAKKAISPAALNATAIASQ